METTTYQPNPKHPVVKKRGRAHPDGGCIVCGSQDAAAYEFYCARLIGKQTSQVTGSRDKMVKRTYEREQTVQGLLCPQCIRTANVAGVRNSAIAIVVIIALWVLLWKLHVGLLILPILALAAAVFSLILCIVRLCRKVPTQEDGDDLLRDLLRERCPGYDKYMTRREWNALNKQ